VQTAIKTLFSFNKNEERTKENSPRAQTMPDASFGPFYVVSALPVVHNVNRNYKTLVSFNKHEEKKKKNSPRARFHRLRLSLSCITFIESINHWLVSIRMKKKEKNNHQGPK